MQRRVPDGKLPRGGHKEVGEGGAVTGANVVKKWLDQPFFRAPNVHHGMK